MTFTARAGGTEPIPFTWALGDGVTATGAVVIHSHAARGTYTVTLAAANACGRQVLRETLTVLDLAPVRRDSM
ncbi:MAG: PKD domain-containing protein [Chloroflexia bacterium]|nr:PKD domain-containing protein [Chloroflexia bacterium]